MGGARDDARQCRRSCRPLPTFSEAWQLGTPDVVVQMPEAYVLPCAAARCLPHVRHPDSGRRPPHTSGPLNFCPGNARVVHHANIKVDRTRLSRRRDDDEPGAGYEGGGSREAKFPDGMFLGWTPGQSPRLSPEGMSWHLEPQSDLVVELHLMPGDQPQPVQVSVGLFFTDQRPSRTGYMLRLGRQDIDIAAGQRDYVNADTYTLPVDVDALAVQPHAHFLAKEVARMGDAAGRRGRAACLHQGLELSLAGRLHVRAAARVAQRDRHRDALHVRQLHGESRESESASQACDVRSDQRVGDGLAVAPGCAEPAADLARLEQDFGPKILRDDIAGNEKWLEVEPRNAQLRAELAACYLEANRPADALMQLNEAARLDPTAGRHYDVGRVPLIQQDYGAAETSFQKRLP